MKLTTIRIVIKKFLYNKAYSLNSSQVIDKKITTTDTGIHFKKLKSMKLSFLDYSKFLEDLAKTKKVELDEIKSKMANCGAPGIHNATVGSIVTFDRKFFVLHSIDCSPGKQARR